MAEAISVRFAATCPDCSNQGETGTLLFVGEVGPHPELPQTHYKITVLRCLCCGYRADPTPWGVFRDCPHCWIGSPPEDWKARKCPECGKGGPQ